MQMTGFPLQNFFEFMAEWSASDWCKSMVLEKNRSIIFLYRVL